MAVKLTKFIEDRRLKCGLPEVLEELGQYRFTDTNLRNDITMALSIFASEPAGGRWIFGRARAAVAIR